jgi:uncharacterized protein (TIGR02145 family)
MNKDNIFKSSEFYMSENDVLHMIIKDESGVHATMQLYGEVSPDVPEAEFIEDADGNIYTFVTIGSQQWMVENLKTTKYTDGTPIPNLTLAADWLAEDGSVGHDGAYCAYDNDNANIANYGALYNSYAIANTHGLAPTGWKVADITDYSNLLTYIGGVASSYGCKLKETGETRWDAPNSCALDTYGLKFTGAGIRNWAGTGLFTDLKQRGLYAQNNTHYRSCTYDSGYFSSYGLPVRLGLSVRCMRDI